MSISKLIEVVKEIIIEDELFATLVCAFLAYFLVLIVIGVLVALGIWYIFGFFGLYLRLIITIIAGIVGAFMAAILLFNYEEDFMLS